MYVMPKQRRIKPKWRVPINVNSPQYQGLVGWWPCSPAMGNILYDQSGKGRNGTLTNMTSQNWGVVPPGEQQRVLTIPATARINVNPFNSPRKTIAVWVMSTGSGTREITNDTGDIFVIRFASATGPPACIVNTTSGVAATGTTSLSNSVLHHVCGSYDGANVKLYVNGRRVATAAQTGNVQNTSTRYFGVHQNLSANQLAGSFYEIREYNRGLSDAEAWALYDPKTRWDLYLPLWRSPLPVASAAAAAASLIFPSSFQHILVR